MASVYDREDVKPAHNPFCLPHDPIHGSVRSVRSSATPTFITRQPLTSIARIAHQIKASVTDNPHFLNFHTHIKNWNESEVVLNLLTHFHFVDPTPHWAG